MLARKVAIVPLIPGLNTLVNDLAHNHENVVGVRIESDLALSDVKALEEELSANQWVEKVIFIGLGSQSETVIAGVLTSSEYIAFNTFDSLHAAVTELISKLTRSDQVEKSQLRIIITSCQEPQTNMQARDLKAIAATAGSLLKDRGHSNSIDFRAPETQLNLIEHEIVVDLSFICTSVAHRTVGAYIGLRDIDNHLEKSDVECAEMIALEIERVLQGTADEERTRFTRVIYGK